MTTQEGTASSVFGRQVKDARRRLSRMTQAELARRLRTLGFENMRQVSIARLEKPGKRGVSLDDAFAVAAAFGVSPLWLLSGRLTNEAIDVTPKHRAGARQMELWLDGTTALPDTDERAFLEVVPDDEQVARLARGLGHMRAAFRDFREAMAADNHGAMRDAVRDLQRELERQEEDLARLAKRTTPARAVREKEED